MSFKVNSSQQISFNDSVFSLTAREKKALDNSWAKIFADEIFPNIDEERFSVLYSSKASRPNAPVNVIIGALIIKELFDYSDDEIVENLMLDLHLQYALHTTSFEEQPISDKTLSRFRSRCYNYETTHGTGGKTENLSLVQMPVLVVFNIFNYCAGSCKPCFPDAAEQFVILPAVPFRIYQKGQPFLKAHLAVCGGVSHLPFQFRGHGAESHGFQGFNRRIVPHLEPPPFRK